MANYTAILGAVKEQAAAEQQALLDTRNLYFAMGQNASEAAKEQADASVNFNGRTESVDSVKQRLQADLEAQRQKQKAKETINYDELSMSLLEETAQLAAERRSLAAKISKDSSVSLFENPIQAIVNAFTLPWDQQALEGVNQQLDVVNKTSDSVNAQLTKFSDTTDKLKQSLTQSSIDSVAKSIEADQRIKVLKAHNEALSTDAKGIEAVTRLGHQQLMTLKAGYDIVATEENRQYMREAREAALEERRALRESKDRQATLVMEEVGLAKEAMIKDGYINKDGTPRFSDEEIRRGIEAKRPFFVHFAERGFVSRLQGRAAHGESPIERIESWQLTGYEPKAEGEVKLAALNIKAQNATKDIKDKKERAAAAQKYLMEELDKLQDSAGAGDKSNPLSLPSFESMGITSALTRSPAYALVKDLVESKETKDKPIDPQVVYSRLLEGIKNKHVSETAATEFLFDMAMSSKEYNSRTGNVYKLTGWDQTRVGAELRPGSGFGDAMLTMGPIIAAAGALTGVGTIPAVAIGGGITAIGAANVRAPLRVDLLNKDEIKLAIARGLSARMVDSTLDTDAINADLRKKNLEEFEQKYPEWFKGSAAGVTRRIQAER